MTGCGQSWRLLAVRFLMSLPFLAGSTILFLNMDVVTMFIAVGLMIPPAFIMSEPLSELFAHPIGSIYHPDKRRNAPALMFSLPEACIMHGRYVEAMEHYRGMTRLDPLRAQVYVRMVDLALRHMHEPELARDAYHQGMSTLDSLEKKEYLAGEYSRLLTLFSEGKLT
jgi:hypothetical protein